MDSTTSVVITFPGNFCIFNEDGTILTTGKDGLRKLSPEDQVLWHLPGQFHHQMNLSLDGKNILTLLSDVIDWKGKKLRLDKFIVIDQEGKILHAVRADELFTQTGIEFHEFEVEPALLAATGAKSESSHFNSFYEIPETSKLRRMRPRGARYILNSLTSGVFFVSDDLKTVVKHLRLRESQDHQVHDVQLLENGHLFYFNNVTVGSIPGKRSSAIQEYDFVSEKIVAEFRTSPETFFYSRFGGSAQQLNNEEWLFSDMLTATHIYNVKKKKLVASLNETHAWNGRPFGIPTFQVKSQDLSRFFNSRKSSVRK